MWTGIGFALIPALPGGISPALAEAEQSKDESLRPEVGKPLQAAQELVKAQKYKEALARIQEAEAVGNRTPYESYIIERMRVAAAAGAGDTETAIKATEAVIASGRLPPAEQLKMIEAVAGSAYRAKDYPKAIVWSSRYLKEGGANQTIHSVLIQSYYLSNDFAGAARELQTEIQADETAGRTPPEDRLQMLANAYLRQNDNAGYAATLETLVTHYPKKEYWADLINRIQRKPGFADRLSLDVFRLQFATSKVSDGGSYIEMAQLALQSGFPAEAKRVVDQGFTAGVLGTGADADRYRRLRDLANKQAAEDQKSLAQSEAEAAAARNGIALINTGFNYVIIGQFAKGIALMEQGIAKGGLKFTEDEKLHLGYAYLLGGQKAKAIQMFKTVQGKDGTADLARLWLVHANSPAA
jgi:hypothetical protein